MPDDVIVSLKMPRGAEDMPMKRKMKRSG